MKPDWTESPYGVIDASSHQETLVLLGEVADYLSRLPAHPMTHAILQRVKSHLESPSASAQNRRLSTLAESQVSSARIQLGERTEGVWSYDESGLPILEAELLYPVLRLNSPAVQHYRDQGDDLQAEKFATVIASEISSGMSIKMGLIDPKLEQLRSKLARKASTANEADQNSQ